MKPRTKKRLIVIGTLLFLGGTIYREFNYNYFLAKRLGQTQKSQEIFWRQVDEGSMEEMGVNDLFREGGLGIFSSAPKIFSLRLNDQWIAQYSYERQNEEYVLRIALMRPGENAGNGFSFYVNQEDLAVIKDDQKYRGSSVLATPDERQQIDRETTPDSITDTDYLEKLALEKFVEFQDEYFKVIGY